MPSGGQMLCGTTIAIAGSANTNLLAEILSVSGIGGTRVAVDGTNSNNTSAGWGAKLFSCIANLDPFTVMISFDGNFNWAAALLAAPGTCTITLPVQAGQTTAATITFKAGVTKFVFSGELMGRMTASVEITPSGAPTCTAGTT